MFSRVALTSGGSRQENILKALDLIKDDFVVSLKKAKDIIIKPNFVAAEKPLACTQGEAVKAVLNFISKYNQRKIIIAEAAAIGETDAGYRINGFYPLIKKYNVELVDLNRERKFREVKIYNRGLGKNKKIKLFERLARSDFLISVGPPKTHDSAIVTMSVKNIAVGAIKNSDRSKIHQGPRAINRSLCEIAKNVKAHLAIVDGFIGMEGLGPGDGDRVEHQIALAGVDSVAVDSVGAKLMGFNPKDVGYLHFCGLENVGENDLSKIDVLGEKIGGHIINYQPHPGYEAQLSWK
jgi:uncharacterized protein (DUF362 family)